jgi:hypothetical protein
MPRSMISGHPFLVCGFARIVMAQLENSSEKAAALLMQFPGPVVLHVSKFKYLLLVAPVLIVEAPAFFLLLPVKNLILVGVVVVTLILIPILILVLMAMSLVKDMPRITLDAEGFAFHGLVGVSRWRWHDVSRFAPRFVFVLFSDALLPPRWWNRRILASFFELTASDVAHLMTSWRARTLAQRQ